MSKRGVYTCIDPAFKRKLKREAADLDISMLELTRRKARKEDPFNKKCKPKRVGAKYEFKI